MRLDFTRMPHGAWQFELGRLVLLWGNWSFGWKLGRRTISAGRFQLWIG
jgi:hypothetical protein